jgi:tRNA pseudouridine38-40 synthase
MSEQSAGQYIRAVVSYDGTDFLGFQWQSKGRTVQGVLEGVLGGLGVLASRVVCSGRTDSGVHAMGQVVAFRLVWTHPLAELQRALNAVLPADVSVRDVQPALEGWHPRFSAVRRYYRYTVLSQPVRSPLLRRTAYWLPQSLDLVALQRAGQRLLGEHDFASFGRPTQGDNTVRYLFAIDWQQDGSLFTLDVTGNAFLRGMVRSLVGTMLQVGMGSWPETRVTEVLQARDRSVAAAPAPGCGLCLMHVDYREDCLSISADE